MIYSAPARIDLGGGTLDVPPLHYLIENSLTLNLAIDLRVSIDVRRGGSGLLFTRDEQPQQLDSLPIFSLVLDHFAVRDVDIHLQTAIPKAAGLGGSSSLVVALVHALGLAGPEVVGDVTVLEHRLLGKPAGTQDAVAAIFGGLSKITFEHGTPHRQALACPSFLREPLYLAYSKVQHHSGINNWAIIKAVCEGDRDMRNTLQALCENSYAMVAAIAENNRDQFTELLQTEARLRRDLCPSITTPEMEAFAKHFGERLACKVCGAGGGGAMFLFGENPDVDELHWAATRHQLQIIETRLDMRGCTKDGT